MTIKFIYFRPKANHRINCQATTATECEFLLTYSSPRIANNNLEHFLNLWHSQLQIMSTDPEQIENVLNSYFDKRTIPANTKKWVNDDITFLRSVDTVEVNCKFYKLGKCSLTHMFSHNVPRWKCEAQNIKDDKDTTYLEYYAKLWLMWDGLAWAL